MTNIPDDPERIERDTEAAADRHGETMAILARSRATQGLTLSENLVAAATRASATKSNGAV